MAKTATTKTPVEKIAAFDVGRMTEDITGLIKRVSALHTEIAAIPPDKRTRSISTIESALRSTEAELQRIPPALGYARDPESRRGQTVPKRSVGSLRKPPSKVVAATLLATPSQTPVTIDPLPSSTGKPKAPVAKQPTTQASKPPVATGKQATPDPTVKTGFQTQKVN